MRISNFLDRTRSLGWSRAEIANSLNAVVFELDELAQAEVRYYFRQRKYRARSSFWLRLAAWIFGTLGLLAPLAGGAMGRPTLEKWGYVLLAVSASAIAANTLFSSTSEHIRYTTTQLALERLIITFRVDWFQMRALRGTFETDEAIEAAFALMLRFVDAVSKTILDETNAWGSTLEEAIETFATSTKPAPRR